jgi:hypothetical protein
MFELLLVACVAGRFCEYIASPVAYPHEERCIQQAAMLAGMVRGRRAPTLALAYRYKCIAEDGTTAGWVHVEPRQEPVSTVATRP